MQMQRNARNSFGNHEDLEAAFDHILALCSRGFQAPECAGAIINPTLTTGGMEHP